MNELVEDRQLQGWCGEVLEMAQRELTAFYAAVKKLFGTAAAGFAAEEWIAAVRNSDSLPASLREWRQITIAALQKLALRMESCAA